MSHAAYIITLYAANRAGEPQVRTVYRGGHAEGIDAGTRELRRHLNAFRPNHLYDSVTVSTWDKTRLQLRIIHAETVKDTDPAYPLAGASTEDTEGGPDGA